MHLDAVAEVMTDQKHVLNAMICNVETDNVGQPDALNRELKNAILKYLDDRRKM